MLGFMDFGVQGLGFIGFLVFYVTCTDLISGGVLGCVGLLLDLGCVYGSGNGKCLPSS